MAHLGGLYLLIGALIAIIPANVADWCQVDDCFNSHTMCKYSPGPSANCKEVQQEGLTPAEIEAVLEEHNDLRAKVAKGDEKRGSPGPQPRASNLESLTWDDEIAEIAQRWADQCQFGHDQCRDDDRFRIGQNVGMLGTTGPTNNNLAQIVLNWYNEVKDFDRHQVSGFTNLYNNGKAVGHYTQLVWANTEYVGCGAVRYKADGWNNTYLVCNYGPAGNVLGQPVYKVA